MSFENLGRINFWAAGLGPERALNPHPRRVHLLGHDRRANLGPSHAPVMIEVICLVLARQNLAIPARSALCRLGRNSGHSSHQA